MIWRNHKSSSTAFCRPIQFSFQKETEACVKQLTEALKNAISTLIPTKCIVVNKEFQVRHSVHITIIDGKVITILSDKTSSNQCCAICGASLKQMNDIALIKSRTVSNETLKYQISSLHS